MEDERVSVQDAAQEFKKWGPLGSAEEGREGGWVVEGRGRTGRSNCVRDRNEQYKLHE